ncbi:MAG: DUF481 domain-containing protein [Phycisphaerales bacterium]|nr:MAG: DUF481 domain-containing protein [Phycisphaerales bacterium]
MRRRTSVARLDPVSRPARLAAALLIGSFAAATGALADEPVRVKLASGEVLIVSDVRIDGDSVRFTHPVLGELTLPAASVTLLDTPEAPRQEPETIETDPPAAPPAPAEEKPAPVEPVRKSFFEGWTGSFEGGLTGSEGNTDTLNFRFSVSVERITDYMETRANAFYTRGEEDGEVTRDRAELFVRNDWLFKDSPWGFFAQSRLEYDKFQDWDLRLALFAGPTYTFINNDRTLLRGRAGAGATFNIGADDEDDVVPEGLLGVDFRHQLTERQSIFLSTEYLPSFSDFGEFRLNTDAGYEILVDPEVNLFLKLGANHRYNSNAGAGNDKNDLDYYLTVGFRF